MERVKTYYYLDTMTEQAGAFTAAQVDEIEKKCMELRSAAICDALSSFFTMVPSMIRRLSRSTAPVDNHSGGNTISVSAQ